MFDLGAFLTNEWKKHPNYMDLGVMLIYLPNQTIICRSKESCLFMQHVTSAVPSKIAVSANIKHSRYFHETFNLYVHMVNTAFSYGRTLIIC